jgi:hypothetical protein
MFRINDPGPWQNYHQRLDNRGLNAQQLKQKYLTEQRLFEQQQLEDYLNWSRIQATGGPTEFFDNEYVAYDYVVGDYFE